MAEFRIDPEMELPVLPSRARADVSRKPKWLKINLRTDAEFVELKRLMRGQGLHTVCEEARCPNIGECWDRRHGHLHDPGRHLHPGVRVLRVRRAGPPGWTGRSLSGWRRRWRALGLRPRWSPP